MPADKRFGSTDSFLEASTWNFRMGRPLANVGFVQALLNFGHFDAYDFFLADAAAAQAWEKSLSKWVPDAQSRARVQVHTQTQLHQALRQRTYQVFHQGDFTYFMPHLVALRNSLENNPFSVTGITHSLDSLQHRFLQLSLAGLQAYDAVVCTSSAAQMLVRRKFAEVQELLARRFAVRLPLQVQTPCIALGIDDSCYAPADPDAVATQRLAARQSLQISPETLVYLAVGRLSLRAKADWSPYLELFAQMRAAGALQKTLVVLAGGAAPEAEQLLRGLVQRYRLQDHVRLVVNFSPAQKARLFAASDIFLALIDNLQETFGLSVIEAMAAGLPVIAADYDGLRDSVQHGKEGLLIATLTSTELPTCLQESLGLLDPSIVRLVAGQMTAVDLQALRHAMDLLAADVALRRRLGSAARRRAEAYRWPGIIAAYETLWTELAARARPAPTAASVPHEGPKGLGPATARPPAAAGPAGPAPTAHDVPPGPAAATAGALPSTSFAALLGGDGLHAYRGFVTHLLRATDQFERSERGTALVAGQPVDLTRYEDIARLLNPQVEAALLQACGQSCAVAQLRRLGLQAGAHSVGDVDFQLSWLAKHGLVKLLGKGQGSGKDT
jgi:glycosyltransferase involved in cell wall biosynthesis